MVSTATTMDLSLVANPAVLMSIDPIRLDSVLTGSEQPLGFMFSDLRSAERVMTMSNLDLKMAAAATTDTISITVACCCTPCCCAVAVMKPVAVS
ncbi:MAG TPA: hypothetical protein VGL53_15780 [Bryobacteraceae bacterium]|jgi:hypothetical protein